MKKEAGKNARRLAALAAISLLAVTGCSAGTKRLSNNVAEANRVNRTAVHSTNKTNTTPVRATQKPKRTRVYSVNRNNGASSVTRNGTAVYSSGVTNGAASYASNGAVNRASSGGTQTRQSSGNTAAARRLVKTVRSAVHNNLNNRAVPNYAGRTVVTRQPKRKTTTVNQTGRVVTKNDAPTADTILATTNGSTINGSTDRTPYRAKVSEFSKIAGNPLSVN